MVEIMKNRSYPLYQTEQIHNLKELVNNAAGRYGKASVFTFEKEDERIDVSYEQFSRDVNALGTAMFHFGIRDTKVALIGENSYEWILSYLATVNGGNTIIPLDRELPLADLAELLKNCQASVLLYSEDYKDIADGLDDGQLDIKYKFNIKKELPDIIEKGNEIIKTDKSYVDYKIDNDTMAAIIYTSGTTGFSKGIMLSHRNIACDVVISCETAHFSGVSLLVLPLHHAFALTGGVLIMMHYGCNIVINKSLKNILQDLVKYKPDNILLVPLFVETFYKKIWDTAKKSDKERALKILVKISNALLNMGIDIRTKLFRSILSAFGGELDVIVTGGAPIDEKFIKGFREFGIKVLNGYGISECSPVVSVNRNNYYRDGSVGVVLPGLELKILEPAEDGHGEICVKGDIVMLGYYKNEQAEREAFDGDWFKTGDIGYLDKDGFLFISGRKKNMIILNNGKNVYPEELEFSLQNHIPYIKEVVVYAKDNAIAAEVFLDTEYMPDCALRLDDDILQFNQIQPPYKNIGKVVIREAEFPKTTTKKIKR